MTSPEIYVRPADTQLMVHLVCLTCYPEAKAGDKAICGHVGTRGAVYGRGPDCIVCLDLSGAHTEGHAV